jgi:hypothetical protein
MLQPGTRYSFWRQDDRTHYDMATAAGEDAFGAWVLAQDQREDRAASTRYVSPEMTGATDLDRYGRWDTHPEYGAVWFPTLVVTNWAPYRYGHWAWVGPWGWSWVDDAPWGFAPFHYGRWASWRGRWCWVPGRYVARPVYAPALVGWIGGNNFNVGVTVGGVHRAPPPVIGWVPLGPRDPFVPRFNATPRYIRGVNAGHAPWLPPGGAPSWGNRHIPGAVTVVPANTLQQHVRVAERMLPRAEPRWNAALPQQQPALPRPEALVARPFPRGQGPGAAAGLVPPPPSIARPALPQTPPMPQGVARMPPGVGAQSPGVAAQPPGVVAQPHGVFTPPQGANPDRTYSTVPRPSGQAGMEPGGGRRPWPGGVAEQPRPQAPQVPQVPGAVPPPGTAQPPRDAAPVQPDIAHRGPRERLGGPAWPLQRAPGYQGGDSMPGQPPRAGRDQVVRPEPGGTGGQQGWEHARPVMPTLPGQRTQPAPVAPAAPPAIAAPRPVQPPVPAQPQAPMHPQPPVQVAPPHVVQPPAQAAPAPGVGHGGAERPWAGQGGGRPGGAWQGGGPDGAGGRPGGWQGGGDRPGGWQQGGGDRPGAGQGGDRQGGGRIGGGPRERM